jgi:hypothetical protein
MVNKVLRALELACLTGGLVRKLDIIVAGIEVLVGEVEANPRRASLGVEEECPDPIQADDSRAVTAVMTWCGGFLPLLHLRDLSNGDVGV